jgi:hypothetical protein
MADLSDSLEALSRAEETAEVAGEALEGSENIENLSESLGVGSSELKENALTFGEGYMDELRNGPGAGEMANEIEVVSRELEQVNSQIMAREEEFRGLLTSGTDGFEAGQPTAVEEEGIPAEEAPEEISQDALKGEVVFHQGEWWVEDIDPATKEWLEQTEEFKEAMDEDPQVREKYEETFNAEYTPEEKQEAESGFKATEDLIKSRGALNSEQFSKLEESEGNQEMMRLVLRLAIKVGAKVAVAVARNIAKDKETPYELRVALGAMADLIGDGSIFVDKMISGDDRPDLARDLRHAFLDGSETTPPSPDISSETPDVPDIDVEA